MPVVRSRPLTREPAAAAASGQCVPTLLSRGAALRRSCVGGPCPALSGPVRPHPGKQAPCPDCVAADRTAVRRPCRMQHWSSGCGEQKPNKTETRLGRAGVSASPRMRPSAPVIRGPRGRLGQISLCQILAGEQAHGCSRDGQFRRTSGTRRNRTSQCLRCHALSCAVMRCRMLSFPVIRRGPSGEASRRSPAAGEVQLFLLSREARMHCGRHQDI